jgi:hypothetical protein
MRWDFLSQSDDAWFGHAAAFRPAWLTEPLREAVGQGVAAADDRVQGARVLPVPLDLARAGLL